MPSQITRPLLVTDATRSRPRPRAAGAGGSTPARALLLVGAMSRCTAFALLLAAAGVACTDAGAVDDRQLSQDESAIVGGTAVEPGDWPDAVAVLGMRGTCSGTLIARDVVLTAGHCAGIEPTQVIANTIDYARPGGIRVGVAAIEAYPDWPASYDVALLLLASPIDEVEPRRIGTSCTFERFTPSTLVHLVGFGATNVTGTAANTQLREAIAPVTDPDCTGGNGCKPALVPGGEFVAGGTGDADSCFGDSGGPVYLDTPSGPVVVGAVSRGVADSTLPCGSGGIYVRTDKLVTWLEETSGTQVAKDNCEGEASYAGGDEVGGQAGCAATGGSGVGALGLVVLVARRKRARRWPRGDGRAVTVAR